jgi:uncharacterized protein (TIGR03083 family)
MTDDRELAGLDPFALLDTEAGRLDAFLSGLGEAGWQRASRCAGWTVRDVLGHLAAGEDYHRACLDGTSAGSSTWCRAIAGMQTQRYRGMSSDAFAAPASGTRG